MTHKYHYLRLWLASLCLLAGMHTCGFSMNSSEEFTEEYAQRTFRNLQEQNPLIMTMFMDRTDRVIMVKKGKSEEKIKLVEQAETRNKWQPGGDVLSIPITAAVFAHFDSTPFTQLSVMLNLLCALANKHDLFIQNLLGGKESLSWKSYNSLLWGAAASGLYYNLTGNEYAKSFSVGIMFGHAVFNTATYVFDWQMQRFLNNN